jgi:hypothetical protein
MATDNSPPTTEPNARDIARQTVEDWQTAWELASLVHTGVPALELTPDMLPEAHKQDLLQVCRHGHVQALEDLIRRGISIHGENEAALRTAANYGHIEVVKIILAHGANIHADNEGALRWAGSGGHIETMQFLLENGADIHTENDYPLRVAASGGHLKAVRFLLANGADIHANNDDTLRLAVRGGHTETVCFLLANGANARVNNDAALLKAIEGKQTEIIHLLVAHGAPLAMLPPTQRQAYDIYDQKETVLKNSLSDIFKAATWAGHVPEMVALWQQLPEMLQTKLDFPHLLAAATQQTMKQRSKKVSFTK